ncbi:MAG: hypothetical protein BJ554DRAFT_2069 [Olpidium bornovanus]|uniref:AN1-type domain-containing protein n=1 Tax=Olpidium bornovanus TaxID=278681 RepID=A0A8H8DGL4_9FUNG|nr:MAG: hypothetical protein BJ554DRAFT_2069 [Olpidium bornovanus]
MSPQIPTPPQPLDSSAPQSAAGAAAAVNSPAGDTCARQAASSHLQPIDVLKRDSAGTPTSDTGSDAGVSSSREQKFKNRCFKCKTKETKKESLRPPAVSGVLIRNISFVCTRSARRKRKPFKQTRPTQFLRLRTSTSYLSSPAYRLFLLRSPARRQIPLALQITNKCRCEYIFCNSHKHPDEHSCDFDHKSEGKAILAMNSPKLDDNRGGRSFNRLV